MSHAGRPCVRCGFYRVSHGMTPDACHQYVKPAGAGLKIRSALLGLLARLARKD